MKSVVALRMILAAGLLVACEFVSVPTLPPPVPPEPCLASGNQDTINAQLQGPGDIAFSARERC
jgi:hypothetical protein